MRRAECSRNKGGDVAIASGRVVCIHPPAGAVTAIAMTEAPSEAADAPALAVDGTASQDAA